jgi:hypothetical protein
MTRVADVVDQWWKTFEQGDFDALMRFWSHPTRRSSCPAALVFAVRPRFVRCSRLYCNGSPELRHEIVSAVESDTAMAIELKITMPHAGVLVTPQGEIPPTGKVVVLDACDVERVDSSGTIASSHSYFDQASMMARLGLVP